MRLFRSRQGSCDARPRADVDVCFTDGEAHKSFPRTPVRRLQGGPADAEAQTRETFLNLDEQGLCRLLHASPGVGCRSPPTGASTASRRSAGARPTSRTAVATLRVERLQLGVLQVAALARRPRGGSDGDHNPVRELPPGSPPDAFRPAGLWGEDAGTSALSARESCTRPGGRTNTPSGLLDRAVPRSANRPQSAQVVLRNVIESNSKLGTECVTEIIPCL